jgi:hypothetical protein
LFSGLNQFADISLYTLDVTGGSVPSLAANAAAPYVYLSANNWHTAVYNFYVQGLVLPF